MSETMHLNKGITFCAKCSKELIKEMDMKDYYEQQLKSVILNTCNLIGCKDCHDKWYGGCVATELQNKIFDLQEEEQKDNANNRNTTWN